MKKREKLLILILILIAIVEIVVYIIIQIQNPWIRTSTTDSMWYSYGGMKVNAPKMKGEMTPIKYIGDKNGETNLWANARTKDGSMWVWIPRYAYKITEGYHTNSQEGITIEVAFTRINEDGNEEFLNPSVDSGEITKNPTDEGAGTTKWLVHPAFTSNPENGGWSTELSGIWIGKFETTGVYNSNNKEITLSVKPGVESLSDLAINEQYKLAKSSTFGESVSAEELGSHMAKNSEWGAAVYLGHSKYGTNGRNIEESTFYTGGSTTAKDIYKENIKQSTTYNATGIYDLNGGTAEYVASYVNYGNNASDLATYGGTNEGDLYGETAEEQATSTPYKTVYNVSGNNSKTSYNLCSKIKGDAIYETSSEYKNSEGSWFGASMEFPNIYNPFFERGDSISAFCLEDSSGDVKIDIKENKKNIVKVDSFRMVLAF